MQFSIDKKALQIELAKVCPVAEKKNPMPILTNVLLAADKKKIRLQASNMYIGVACTVAAEVKEAGSVAVPADTLFDIVKNLPEGKVTFALEKNDTARITMGSKIRLKLNSMPGEKFPVLPTPPKNKSGEFLIESFSKLIALTRHGICEDDARPGLMNLHLECTDKIVRAIAVDGHQLAKAEYTLDKSEKPLKLEMNIPLLGVTELKRLLDVPKDEKESPIKIKVDDKGNAFFEVANTILSVKLSEDEFPPWKDVIPKGLNKKVLLPREAFANAMKRISLFSGEHTNYVRLVLSADLLTVTSASTQIGEGVEKIKTEYKGKELEIGFSAPLFLDAMKSLPDENIELHLGVLSDPAMITPESTPFVGVIMPISLD